jgi:hypothetical protein
LQISRGRFRSRRKLDVFLRVHNYGSIGQLQSILGLDTAQSLDANVIFLSLDLEWERRGLLDRITEIGVTTLRVRDIVDTKPGPFATSWKDKMNHGMRLVRLRILGDART